MSCLLWTHPYRKVHFLLHCSSHFSIIGTLFSWMALKHRSSIRQWSRYFMITFYFIIEAFYFWQNPYDKINDIFKNQIYPCKLFAAMRFNTSRQVGRKMILIIRYRLHIHLYLKASVSWIHIVLSRVSTLKGKTFLCSGMCVAFSLH